MSRVTRKKAAEIAEQLQVDEDAVLDMNSEDAAPRAKLATPDPSKRSPLGELEPNSAESKTTEAESIKELKKSTKGGKAGKKGVAKGKKDGLAASTATPLEESDVVPDDNDSAPSPASETATQNLRSNELDVGAAHARLQPDRSHSPPSAAVRLTRSRLAHKTEDNPEPKSLIDGIGQAPQEQQGDVGSNDRPTLQTSKPTGVAETAMPSAMDAPTSPIPTAVPNIIHNLRSETPAKRSTSNKENVQPALEANNLISPRPQSSTYDTLEEAVVAASTPPRSEGHASPRPEDSIAALDELEDAVESVSRDIPEVQTSPEKRKSGSKEMTNAQPVRKEDSKAGGVRTADVKDSKKAAPVVRTTKASQARISMAQNKDVAGKTPSLGRPRPSTTLGRSSSVRQTVAPKPEGASKRVPSNPIARTAVRPTSLKASADGEKREKKETVIPHSKPRPISLSFPTPPPPPKATKAPTQSTFQLPGEAVAAKLKAAREARMAKEAEAAEKKETRVAFKARPAPKTSGEVPSVRPTNASRARESIMSGKPATSLGSSHKRSKTVTTVDRARTVSTEAKSTSTAPNKPRASTSLAHIPKTRSSLATDPAKPSTSGARAPSGGTSKGKEVFGRAAHAKAVAEKEKAEKEGAAKKARAEAAERGRVASREWAEKQRLRKLGIKPEGPAKAAQKPAAVPEARGAVATDQSRAVEGVEEAVAITASEEAYTVDTA